MSLTKLSLIGNNKIISVQESLVSDIPAEGRKIANLFLQCTTVKKSTKIYKNVRRSDD
jgi:hypothetical protein